jgi:hypothetical protein
LRRGEKMSEEVAAISASTLRSVELRTGVPFKELRFGEGVFAKFLERGEAAATIRRGWRDFEPGEKVIAVCAEGDRLLVRIVRCDYYQLISVPIQDLQDDGFTNRREALECLRRFYPDLTYRSIVSVIRLRVLARIAEEE